MSKTKTVTVTISEETAAYLHQLAQSSAIQSGKIEDVASHLFHHKDYQDKGTKDAQPIKLTLDKELREVMQESILKPWVTRDGLYLTFGICAAFSITS